MRVAALLATVTASTPDDEKGSAIEADSSTRPKSKSALRPRARM